MATHCSSNTKPRAWALALCIVAPSCTSTASDTESAGASEADAASEAGPESGAESTGQSEAEASSTSEAETNPSTESSGDGDGDGDGDACVDACPVDGGVQVGCNSRFMYGINLAWVNFGADFGGLAQWGQQGPSEAPAAYEAAFADMEAQGIDTVRWWVFPDFRGDGVLIDGTGRPTGVSELALLDLDAAIDLAEAHDMHLMLTLFSFDGFRPTHTNSGVEIESITPMVQDSQVRAELLQNVVVPFVQRASAHAHAERVVAWDLINEPEWAVTGPSPYDPENFDPIAELAPVDHATMEAFLSELSQSVRANSPALITIGAAAFKWRFAWSQVDYDFHQFHMYSWVDQFWPYDQSPAALGLDDKPVVMGEFPMDGIGGGDDYATMVQTWWDMGYAGALGWQHNESSPAQLGPVKEFADAHSCETRY